ncbi:hypothetical protein HMPREF0519_1203 [Lentilactobacillus hilgardii DSM 20176 = ATCC 8290]|uniref:HTH araC/xylS-type domain-containing protein n=1 Tax=Lentilactobacillus hilgardii (strain ATCC 8290 / DSM 20176 / CCUG 30140 / JCM 1155 / KCTC 3500 / NBRC 15886 / NCIMB 8040 / NRRL B-1843 / 9) TaxID=1423757 RepID=C0XIZ2_LENH9|nr:hypothetical protein HMPREF0519_1203 [Lentilactobacillus hilgardii DSM 20176 = ATCC 8290]
MDPGKHVQNTLTVEEITDNVSLNANYLTRLLKHCTGMTTLQFLTSLKSKLLPCF